jgi:hypothetical protein
MVDDDEVAEPAQPIGVDDLTGGDRAHLFADRAADEPASCGPSAAWHWGTEAPG